LSAELAMQRTQIRADVPASRSCPLLLTYFPFIKLGKELLPTPPLPGDSFVLPCHGRLSHLQISSFKS